MALLSDARIYISKAWLLLVMSRVCGLSSKSFEVFNVMPRYINDFRIHMLEPIIIQNYSITQIVFGSIPLLLLIVYIATFVRSFVGIRSVTHGRQPLKVPYWIPFVGHSFSLALNPFGFIAELVESFGYTTPLRIRAGSLKLNIVSDPALISSIFRSSRRMSTTPGTVFALKRIFNTPKHVIPFYLADTSGMSTDPGPDCQIKPEHRIIYLQASSAHKFLTGASLVDISTRYVKILNRNAQSYGIEQDWKVFPDLYRFLQVEVFRAAVESLFGSYIMTLNPTFVDDFWIFDSYLPVFVRGYPQWLYPDAFRARDRLLEAVKKWHKYANEHSDFTKTGPNDEPWDPYFGTKLVKARHNYGSKTGFMDADALASEDLGLIFAGNTNAVPAVFWYILEVIRDPNLLARALKEVSSCTQQTEGEFDLSKLSNQPLLSSIYAETLRLRIGILVERTPEANDFHLGPWTFPKDTMIGMFSLTTAFHKTFWNTGSDENPHPVETFWAERFLVYPDDENSGPLQNIPSTAPKLQAPKKHASLEKEVRLVPSPSTPKFSLEGLTGAWIPYGGGQRMCPGRHFAKQEIISTFAFLLSRYEIELCSPESPPPKSNMYYYPLGGLPPTGKVPVRIRRRLL